MRVAQPWAGGNWGTICIPRIGQEVVVEFLEGDPDRPLVVGAVYNPAQMPPYTLPANAHTMGFKSNSTKGGGGYNEMVAVDGKGGELIRIHAQYDMDTTVLHDDRQYVVNNRDIKVDGKHTETVKLDMTTVVSEGHQTNIVSTGNQSNEVTAGNQTNVVKAGQMNHQAKNDIIVVSESGAVHIEAETQIELVVGASSLVMKKDGTITLKGTNVTVIGSSVINLNP
jgi:type VI secretion system secreted protein VgrG